MRVVVFPHAAPVDIDDVGQSRQAVLDLDDLIDLFLILDHGEACAAMVQDIGDLLGDRVLVNRHGHAARHLGGDHRPIELGPVPADDGDVVAGAQANVEKSQRQRLDFLRGLGPGPALPDPVFLFTVGRLVAEFRYVPRKQARNRRQLIASSGTSSQGFLPSVGMTDVDLCRLCYNLSSESPGSSNNFFEQAFI